VPENFLIARIVGTASNGIAKVNGLDETNSSFLNENDDLDTNETVDLVNDNSSQDWQRHEVGAQADYMGSGGSPIVNANYSTEQSGFRPTETVGAECLIWGAFQTF
jgi:hypothetical protein